MKQLNAILPTFLAALAFACGGGGSGGGSTAPGTTAPTSLSYAADDVIYLKGVAIAENAPSLSGGSVTFSASPALPPGLSLGANGAISGIPAAQTARATYTITASNSAGSVSTTVDITVARPPRFAYAANQVDNTISLYTIDGVTGQVHPNGFFGTTLTQVAPQKVVAHPNGAWLYAPNLGNPGAVSPNISAYGIDASTGRITPGTPAGTGNGPFDMTIAPDGRFAYVAAEGSNSIWEYSINQSSGLLSLIRAPISHGTLPTAIALHPSGQFAYVAYNGTARVVVYDVNTGNGQLTERSTLDLNIRPRHMKIDPQGARLYVSDDNFRLLVQYEIDAANGDLALLRNRPIGNPSSALEVHPTGRWVLAARADGSVRAWSVADDGALAVTSSSVPTGDVPVDISFDFGGRFAYVTCQGSNEVTTLEVDLGTGVLTPSSVTRTRSNPGGFTTAPGLNPVSPEGRFLYTANEGSDTVTPYQVNAATGQLTAIAVPPVLTADAPGAVAADPLGRFLYVVNVGHRSISTYTLDPVTGAPTQVGLPLVFSGNGMPRDIAIDGSGRFAFVSNAGGAVEAFWIDQGTGELTFVASTPSGGVTPEAITVDPTGQFIYVANLDSSNITAIRFDQGRLAGGQIAQWVVSSNTTVVDGPVTQVTFSPGAERAYACIPGLADQIQPLDIDPESGALSIASAGATDGNDPVAVAFHPDGAWAYAALQGGPGAVAEFDVTDTGDVVKRLELEIGLDPIDMAMDPSGRFLYVVNEVGGDISVFGIDEVTGALSSAGAYSTDMMPQALELVSGF